MAGTVTILKVHPTDALANPVTSNMEVIQFTWLCDASGNADGATSSPGGSTAAFTVTGLLIAALFDPDATDIPTDNYDVVISNGNGLDVLGTAGMNRDTANAEIVQPLDSNGTLIATPMSGETLTLAVTNAGNAKRGVVKLYVERR